MSHGWIRILFAIVARFLQITIFLVFKKLYPKFKTLDNKNMFSLFIMSTISFVLMQGLTALILTDSLNTIQIVVVFAFIFIILCLIAVIVAIYINSKHQKEKRESELMSLSNEMMERSFAELQNSQNAIHQQVHDFKNHIRTISGLIDSDVSAKKYIEDLLSVSYTHVNTVTATTTLSTQL